MQGNKQSKLCPAFCRKKGIKKHIHLTCQVIMLTFQIMSCQIFVSKCNGTHWPWPHIGVGI